MASPSGEATSVPPPTLVRGATVMTLDPAAQCLQALLVLLGEGCQPLVSDALERFDVE